MGDARFCHFRWVFFSPARPSRLAAFRGCPPQLNKKFDELAELVSVDKVDKVSVLSAAIDMITVRGRWRTQARVCPVRFGHACLVRTSVCRPVVPCEEALLLSTVPLPTRPIFLTHQPSRCTLHVPRTGWWVRFPGGPVCSQRLLH